MSLRRHQILTHRGLEPTNSNFFPESSLEAFENHLSRGFGIEFDPNFVRDGIVVSHDATLQRITNGKDGRSFRDLNVDEIVHLPFGEEKKGHIPTLDQILMLIEENDSPINALHLKGKFQTQIFLDILLETLARHEKSLCKILLFDIKPTAARYLKHRKPELILAPSVSDSYDIKRYNDAVHGTLINLDQAIEYRKQGLYEWVWLDEWDLSAENKSKKTLVNEETFAALRGAGYKISLVTPELHGTSPGLLGGEAHQDAESTEKLFKRIKRIIALGPDALCTDYPEEVLKL